MAQIIRFTQTHKNYTAPTAVIAVLFAVLITL